MRLKVTVAAVMIAVLALGCAKKMTTVTPEETTRVYDAPLETVGKVLLTLMAEYDLRVTEIEPEEGVIRTDFTEFEADSERAKKVLQAVSTSEEIQKGRYRMDVLFFEIDKDKVKVQIDCDIEKYSGIHNFSWQDQPSNGYIENRVFETLEERLRLQGFIQ